MEVPNHPGFYQSRSIPLSTVLGVEITPSVDLWHQRALQAEKDNGNLLERIKVLEQRITTLEKVLGVSDG